MAILTILVRLASDRKDAVTGAQAGLCARLARRLALVMETFASHSPAPPAGDWRSPFYGGLGLLLLLLCSCHGQRGRVGG